MNLAARPVPIRWHAGLPIAQASEASLKSDGGPFGWVGGVNDHGDLVCVLPYTIVRKPGLQMVRFKTATIPLLEELGIEEEKTFLNSVVEHFRSVGADMIIPSGNTAIFRTHPAGADVAPYGTYINHLHGPEDVLRSKIRKTYRHNIRKAMEAGVEIKCGAEHLDASYELIAATLRRSGSKFKSHDDFRRTISGLGEYVKIFVAEHNGVVQGCMVAPFSEHTAYNCYAGSREGPILGAMHLLHWEAIRQFRAMGVQRFDFQGVRISPEKGSKQEGILTYKQGFGGSLIQYFVEIPAPPPRVLRVFRGGLPCSWAVTSLTRSATKLVSA